MAAAMVFNLLMVMPLFTAEGGAAAHPQSTDRVGVVYSMTNNPDGNAIIEFNRAVDGTLTYAGEYATGGLGTGPGLLVPGDPLGSQNALIRKHQWLFAVNAGSDEISVFRIRRQGLTLVDKVSSGGDYPVSLTAHEDLLYVVNAGGDGSITGFTIGPHGKLTPLPGSTRSLDATPYVGN
jgi:6-phosphogluconolactonase